MTITDVVVDASALGKGVHATSRVALTAAVGVGARGGLLARLATESVRASAGGGPAKDGEGEDAEGEDAEDRRVGEFVDARADATLRWRDDGVLVTTAALSVERIEGRLETDGGAQLCADVEGVRVSYRVETEAEATAETSRRRNASSSSTLPSHQPDESDPGPRACDRVVISAGMKRAQVATSDAIMGVGGSGAVAAATRCGAASVLAHAPKIRRDGGEFDDDAVGTIRAYASEVDACNHPAPRGRARGRAGALPAEEVDGKIDEIKVKFESTALGREGVVRRRRPRARARRRTPRLVRSDRERDRPERGFRRRARRRGAVARRRRRGRARRRRGGTRRERIRRRHFSAART